MASACWNDEPKIVTYDDSWSSKLAMQECVPMPDISKGGRFSLEQVECLSAAESREFFAKLETEIQGSTFCNGVTLISYQRAKGSVSRELRWHFSRGAKVDFRMPDWIERSWQIDDVRTATSIGGGADGAADIAKKVCEFVKK
jgi:hypothetical protein